MKESDLKIINSESLRNIIIDRLEFASGQGRIQINEWRNFIDYDIIPILREYTVQLRNKK